MRGANPRRKDKTKLKGQNAMERLTYYGGRTGNALGKVGDAVIPRSIILDEISLGPILDKLAAYEDTGLQPNEVGWLRSQWELYGGESGITGVYEERDMLRNQLDNANRKIFMLEAELYATRAKKEKQES